MSKIKKKRRPAALSFKEAVDTTPDIAPCYQVGLKALGGYSGKIDLGDNKACNGSVDIDGCVRAKYPNDNRWDYVFSYRGAAYFVEVHSAESSEVSVVLAKLKWLKDWLNGNAPEIAKLKAVGTPYYWILSSRFNIPNHSPQYRKAAQNGILPIPRLNLE